MILNLSNAQKLYLGNVEISKILFNNAEVFSSFAGDPYSDYVTLLLHMNGLSGSQTFIDSSTNNFILSAFGNTQISTNIKKYGSGSSFFDGSGDYLEAPLDSAFDFGTANFTIECWFYTTNPNWQTILARWGSGGNAFFLGVDQSTQGIQFYLNNSLVCGGGAINLSAWNHVAIVRNGTNILYFLNGTLIQNANWGSQSINSSTEKLRIGFDNNINPHFNGYIDDIRITKGIARYTSNFIPPQHEFSDPSDRYGANVSLLLHMENLQGSTIIKDSSTNNFALTALGNAQLTTTTKKFGTDACLFDGNSLSNVRTISCDAGVFGLDDFTIELWINPNATQSSNFANILQSGSGSFSPGTWRLRRGSFTGNSNPIVPWFDVFFESNNFASITPPSDLIGTFSNNIWSHYAITRQNDIFRIFVNGIKHQETPLTSPVSLNQNQITMGGGLSGYIDEVRITKGVARYTSDFVPQTAPFANPTPVGGIYNAFTQNLLGYWSFDNGTPQPDVKSGTYGISVIDGPESYTSGYYNTAITLTPGIRLRANQNLWNVKTNPLSYTVSFWVRKNANNSTGQESVILGSFFGNMGFVFLNDTLNGLNLNNAFAFILATGTNYQYKSAETIQSMNIGTWYHVTGTYNLPTQTAKLYINGVLAATTTDVLNNDCTNNGWTGFAINGSVVGTTSTEYGNNYSFDMIGIWERTLTDNEVQLLYTDYNSINDFII